MIVVEAVVGVVAMRMGVGWMGSMLRRFSVGYGWYALGIGWEVAEHGWRY